MANLLHDLDVDEVSLVKKGAIKKKFTIIKSEEAPVEDLEDKKVGLVKSIATAIASFMGTEDVEKSYGGEIVSDGGIPKLKTEEPTTFTDMWKQTQINELLDDKMWQLNSALRRTISNIYTTETVIDKPAAVQKALNDFTTYVMVNIVNVIGNVNIVRKEEGDVQEKIRKHYDMLEDMLNIEKAEKVEKGGDDDMDIKEIIEKALGPVVDQLKTFGERMDAIEKAGVVEEVVEKGDEDVVAVMIEAIKPITKSIEDLSGRITALEAQPVVGSQVLKSENEKEVVEKSASKWPSFLKG